MGVAFVAMTGVSTCPYLRAANVRSVGLIKRVYQTFANMQIEFCVC